MKTIAKFCTALSILAFISCGGSVEPSQNENSDNEEMSEEIEDSETEREITAEELPLPAIDDIKARYDSFEIDEVEEITHSDGSISYEVDLVTKDGTVEISYSQAGEYLGIEEKDDDDRENDDDD